MRYPRNAPALDASAHREQILGMGKRRFWKLAKTRVCVAIAPNRSLTRQTRDFVVRSKVRLASIQNATRSDVNCL